MCCFCQSRYNWRLSCEWVRVFPTKKKTSSVLRFPTRPFPTSREEEEYFPEKEKEKILLHMKVRTTVTAFSFSSSAPPRYWTVFSVSVFFFPGPFSGNKRLLTFFFEQRLEKAGDGGYKYIFPNRILFPPRPIRKEGGRKEIGGGREFSSLLSQRCEWHWSPRMGRIFLLLFDRVSIFGGNACELCGRAARELSILKYQRIIFFLESLIEIFSFLEYMCNGGASLWMSFSPLFDISVINCSLGKTAKVHL